MIRFISILSIVFGCSGLTIICAFVTQAYIVLSEEIGQVWTTAILSIFTPFWFYIAASGTLIMFGIIVWVLLDILKELRYIGDDTNESSRILNKIRRNNRNN